MPAYVIFDVDIRDPARYQEFMAGVKPALEKAGAKYLARGGAHKIYEGDCSRGGSCCSNSLPSPRGNPSMKVRPIRA